MRSHEQKTIEKLIKLNVDALGGYRTAAGNTNDTILNTFFNSAALERKGFVRELVKYTDNNKVKADTKGGLHHLWMNLKSSTQEFHAKSILKECARGEKYALDTYQKIIDEKQYPESLEHMVTTQRDAIASKYNQIIAYIEQYKALDDTRNRQTPVP